MKKTIALLLILNLAVGVAIYFKIDNSAKVSDKIAELQYQNKVLGEELAAAYEAMTPPFKEVGNAEVRWLVAEVDRGFEVDPRRHSEDYGDVITGEYDMSSPVAK